MTANKYKEALAKLAEVPNVMVMASPLVLFAAISFIQLGLSHPKTEEDEMADNVRELAKSIQSDLAKISLLIN